MRSPETDILFMGLKRRSCRARHKTPDKAAELNFAYEISPQSPTRNGRLNVAGTTR
jgi:hypothetical protein